MSGTRRAVVIGIDKYSAAPKLDELKGAVRDAKEIHQILTQNGNFIVDHKHFLTDQEATSENIRAAISDIFWKSEEACDIALFYFAGHGVKDHLDYGYLLPHDCDYAAPFVKGIRIQEFKELFSHRKQSRNIKTGIMILDCCYSGIATEPTRGGSDEEADRKNFQDELQLESTGDGRFILASARANEMAREKEQKHSFGQEPPHVHGLYSFHLIEGLNVASDNFGCVSLGALIRYINNKFVGADAKHQPQHSGFGWNEDGIQLTIRPEEHEKELQKSYRKIKDFLEDNSPRGLFAAADVLDRVAIWGEREIVAGYESQIREIFNKWSNYFCNWWFDNDHYIYAHTGNRSGFVILKDNLLDCKLEDIRISKHRSFIVNVMEVILTGMDSQSFQSQNRPCVQQIVKFIEALAYLPVPGVITGFASSSAQTGRAVFPHPAFTASDVLASNTGGSSFYFGTTEPPRDTFDTGSTHGRPPSAPFV